MTAAEQLLTRGKVQLALEKIRTIAAGTRQDVIVLNRLGDLLARHKLVDEAVGYYTQIAEHFAEGGFLPKAVAIHKKILRLNPGCLEAAVSLGQLCGRQKLHGEARKYLLYAGSQFLKNKDFTKAREVYEQLVAGEPKSVRNRVRLAEARAAEGDSERAVEELAGIGDELLDGGKLEDAEKIFTRANGLQPDADRPLIGLSRCLAQSERAEEAVALLEESAGRGTDSPVLLGELARMYVIVGRTKDALKPLGGIAVLEIPPDTWRGIFVAALDRGEADEMWERLDSQCVEENDAAASRSMAALLQRLSDLEPEGYIPALQRLADLHERRNEVGGAVKALDALARAYTVRSMEDKAKEILERLQQIAPPDEEPISRAQAPAPAPQIQIEPTSLVEESAPREIPHEAEAPAVPLNPADEEFVEGRITQAEVLEKYDLLPQALEQLDEVAQRFPGLAPIHERRLELLRSWKDPAQLAEVLAQLAVALRAGGEVTTAREAAAEASSMAELRPASRELLEKLALVAPAERPAAAPAPAPAVAPEAEQPASARAGEVVIELDAPDDVPDDAPREPPAETPAAVRSSGSGLPTRVPAADVIEEIRAVAATDRADALRRLEALVLLGYAGPELDQLRQGLEQPREAEEAKPTAGGQDEISATSAEIGVDLIEGLEIPVVPESETVQDVDEVLDAFKREVAEQLEDEDHRAHYDLAIGYKEMGLIDEAIREFQVAAGSSELIQQACSMIAMCYRDRQEPAQAAEWYRQALEKEPDEETVRAIRYDLAEVLLQDGDAAQALQLFRGVLEVDPAYRDVQGRVTELESRLHS